MGKKETALENLKKAKGFDKNPQNINKDGLNKGSRWSKTLLQELISTNVNVQDNAAFVSLAKKFPKFFTDGDEKGYQLFLELKQISLVFSEDEKVSQTAIEKIKDRIEGKNSTTNNTQININNDKVELIIDDAEWEEI